MCKLRDHEAGKTRKYKERERLNAARSYERNTLEKKLKTMSKDSSKN